MAENGREAVQFVRMREFGFHNVAKGVSGLAMQTSEGISCFAIDDADLSRFVAGVINHAAGRAATTAPSHLDVGHKIPVHRIPVVDFGLADGREPGERTVIFRSGPLTLALAVDSTMLRELASKVLATVPAAESGRSH